MSLHFSPVRTSKYGSENALVRGMSTHESQSDWHESGPPPALGSRGLEPARAVERAQRQARRREPHHRPAVPLRRVVADGEQLPHDEQRGGEERDEEREEEVAGPARQPRAAPPPRRA